MFIKKLYAAAATVSIRSMAIENAHEVCMKLLDDYSPLLETNGPGMYYIDLTGTSRLFGDPVVTGQRIVKRLEDLLGPVAGGIKAGLAGNVAMAELAAKRSRQGRVCSVLNNSGKLRQLLRTSNVGILPGINHKQCRILQQEYNIRTVGELTKLSRSDIHAIFGSAGNEIWEHVHGRGRCYLIPQDKIKSLNKKILFDPPLNEDEKIRHGVFRLFVQLCADMRDRNINVGTLTLILQYQDKAVFYRNKQVKGRHNNELVLFSMISSVLELALKRRVAVTMVKIICAGKEDDPGQQELFAYETAADKLIVAYDAVRHRYGADVLRLGQGL